MLRIGLVNSASGWGGGERIFQELAEGFLAAGHAVTFAARRATPMSARVPAGARLAMLPFANDFDVYTAYRLHGLFLLGRLDAVLCNSGRDAWLAGLAAWPRGIPVLQVKAVVKRRHGARSRFLYRRLLAGVVCVSEAVERSFAGVEIAGRLRVIHNGIHVEPPSAARVEAAKREMGVEEGDFVAVYCGRLSREKGADLLPRIGAEALARGVPLRLAVVGDGELRSELEREVSKLGLRAYFTGFAAEPLPYVAAAQAALVPSRSEGFGLSAVEALAVGTPVVAADTGGLSEIASAGRAALLAVPEDPGSFAGGLASLHREPLLAARLRDNGLARAAEFSREAMVSRYERLIREIIDSKPVPSPQSPAPA